MIKKNYVQNSKIITEDKISAYINDLVDYANSLENNPKLGKVLYIYKNIKIRQLLYKMHRIFYYIENDEIIIIQVVHTSRNVDNTIKYFKDYFELSILDISNIFILIFLFIPLNLLHFLLKRKTKMKKPIFFETSSYLII